MSDRSFAEKYQGKKMPGLDRRDAAIDGEPKQEARDTSEQSTEAVDSSTENPETLRNDYLVTNEQSATDAKKENGAAWLERMKQNLAALDKEGAKPTLADGEELPDRLK